MPDSTRSAGYRQPRTVVAAVLALGVVVLGVWYFASGPGTRLISPEGATVVEFTGTADDVTESFTVRDGWRIRWSTSGEYLRISIRGDRNFGTVVDVEQPDTGVTSPPIGGTFHLEIAGAGPWTIAVLQGE